MDRIHTHFISHGRYTQLRSNEWIKCCSHIEVQHKKIWCRVPRGTINRVWAPWGECELWKPCNLDLATCTFPGWPSAAQSSPGCSKESSDVSWGKRRRCHILLWIQPKRVPVRSRCLVHVPTWSPSPCPSPSPSSTLSPFSFSFPASWPNCRQGGLPALGRRTHAKLGQRPGLLPQRLTKLMKRVL